MPELKTDQRLLDALEQAASRELSHEEIERQRVSFVMGMLDQNNTMTREEVRDVLNRHMGEQRQ